MEKLVTSESVFLNKEFANIKDLFIFIASKAYEIGLIDNEKQVYKSFLKREKQSSTGLEDEIAIPHAKCKGIKKPAIYFIALNKAINWKTLDNSEVKYIFALLIPESSNDVHMSILSNLATKLMDPDYRTKIKNTKCVETIIQLLSEF